MTRHVGPFRHCEFDQDKHPLEGAVGDYTGHDFNYDFWRMAVICRRCLFVVTDKEWHSIDSTERAELIEYTKGVPCVADNTARSFEERNILLQAAQTPKPGVFAKTPLDEKFTRLISFEDE